MIADDGTERVNALVRQILERHGLTVTAAAKHLGVGRKALSKLINERAALSGMMAIRLEKAFGLKLMRFLVALRERRAYWRWKEEEDRIAVRPFGERVKRKRRPRRTWRYS